MERNDEELNQTFDEELVEIDLREYMILIWRKKCFLILLAVIAATAAFFISRQQPSIYETSTLIMVKDEGMGSVFGSDMSSFAVMGQSDKRSTYVEIMKSRTIIEKVIESLDLRSQKGEQLSPEILLSNINITLTESDLIRITVNYSDEIMARDIANKLVEVFQEENQKMNRSDLKNAADFIDSQLEIVNLDLENLEESLLEYKQEHGVAAPDEFASNLLSRLITLETKREEGELALKENRIFLQEAREKFAEQEREEVTSRTITSNPVVSENKARLTKLQIERAGLLEKYTEKHPDVLEIQRKIDEVESVLVEAVEEVVSSRSETINPLYRNLQNQIINQQTAVISQEAVLEALNQRIDEIKKEMVVLPRIELDLLRLQRESQVSENLYLMLKERQAEIEIQQSMQSSDIVIIDPAIVREVPVSPRVKLNVLIAVFLALMLGVFIIFIQEYLDSTIKEEEDVENLTGLPVLGVIPEIDSIDHKQGYGRSGQERNDLDV